MSKIGKQPIKIPAGITLEVEEGNIIVKSEKGIITLPKLRGIKAVVQGGEAKFLPSSEGKQVRSNWGTLRALVYNAIEGLTKGFEKTLILEGIGCRMNKEGNDLVMSLGFSHPVRFKTPSNITFEVEKNSILKIKGFDKALVGQVAAKIRALKKPEPYKGTGFRYADEVIKRKAGKKAVSTAAAA